MEILPNFFLYVLLTITKYATYYYLYNKISLGIYTVILEGRLLQGADPWISRVCENLVFVKDKYIHVSSNSKGKYYIYLIKINGLFGFVQILGGVSFFCLRKNPASPRFFNSTACGIVHSAILLIKTQIDSKY